MEMGVAKRGEGVVIGTIRREMWWYDHKMHMGNGEGVAIGGKSHRTNRKTYRRKKERRYGICMQIILFTRWSTQGIHR